jgi:GTP-binding protein YchF
LGVLKPPEILKLCPSVPSPFGENSLKIGIVGLPNVGKSTLFNAITKSKAPAENYPFCTIEPNVGVVTVPDDRIDKLAQIEKSGKTVPAIVEFVDIAGLVKGASKGEGLGNKFLAHIREVDAIAMVVRCFEDSNIVHVEGTIDPVRDIEVILTELCLADLDTVEKRLQRTEKGKKAGDKEAVAEWDLFQSVKKVLEAGKPAISLPATPEQEKKLKELSLLTRKPFLFIGNVAEGDLADITKNKYYQDLQKYTEAQKAACLPISAKIESEVAELSEEEVVQFLADLGIKERGLHAIIRKSYETLGLISYFTAGPMESRAWTIIKGTLAPKAAGEIHSDIERGFIKAEVYSFDDLKAAGSTAKAREAGKLRTEGKEYVMQDGDVVHFRFNV